MYWIGLLSGTSADGVDAAVAEIAAPPGAAPQLERLLAFRTFPYPDEIRKRVLALCHADAPPLEELLRLDALLGELFAVAAREIARTAGIRFEDVSAVGSHGQTVRHLPERVAEKFSFAGAPLSVETAATFQIGDPSIIAERTGRPIIARFRHRDLAAGGEGAPLAPLLHLALLEHAVAPAAVVNIGGIANVTLALEQPLAFDTGPGNMLLDALAQKFLPGNPRCDEGGKAAAQGEVARDLLEALLLDPYFDRPPPKSTGRERFGEKFFRYFEGSAAKMDLTPQDMLATATALTARTIARAIARYGPKDLKALYVCGGGAHNETLLKMLSDELGTEVATTASLGVDPDAVEALLFAYLAAAHMAGWPGSLPSVTGAFGARVLGELVPGASEGR